MINDDIVVQKILKLLENNTAFIGYALNGGIGTKINVRNTENGKTIQALSINVDSTGEVLVVKDSADNQYKAVNFKTAEKVSERIIQLRKTKPVDDKKTIEYTDSDIEVFYLFVKLIDTGSPVPTQLESTWIRKGSSCTQFVGAYERCNYARRETIGGVSYTGLPYTPYTSLNECLNDDNSPDAKTPNGSKDASGGANVGWRYFSTKVSVAGEASMKAALESHDNYYGTSYKNLFGYGTILECSGAINLKGWQNGTDSKGVSFTSCVFEYLNGYTLDCTPEMEAAGYCDRRGFISSKCPLPGQQAPGKPSVGNVDNSWGHIYGWKDLPYSFMYKRHFSQLYLNGSSAPGSFYILEVNEDQVPGNLPPSYYPWTPYCPSSSSNGGGPYDGSGGGRNPDDAPPIQKRDMKLSTHRAEIWLGSSKKEEAIKLYELGASDLFSGSYNAFITRAEETLIDFATPRNLSGFITENNTLLHNSFYLNRDKNIIDLRIDPRVWVYVLDNKPKAGNQFYYHYAVDPQNKSLQILIDNLYNRTINLTVLDKDSLVVHLKLGLTPSNSLSNTDCKGKVDGFGITQMDQPFFSGQSWEYQKYITIKVTDWRVSSSSGNLDVSSLKEGVWNKRYIEQKFLTSFGCYGFRTKPYTKEGSRELANNLISRVNNNTSLTELLSGDNFEQYNYSIDNLPAYTDGVNFPFYNSSIYIQNNDLFVDGHRKVGVSTYSWWALWDKTHYNSKTERLSSIMGYTKNVSQLFRGFKLDLSLDHSDRNSGSFTDALGYNTYFEYFPSRPLVMIPSNIKSVRDKKLSSSIDFYYKGLSSKQSTLKSFGLNFFSSIQQTLWTETDTFFRIDGLTLPFFQPFPSQYEEGYSHQTRENDLDPRYGFDSATVGVSPKLNTRRWFNNLWAQFIFMGSINVDVDSYKKVKYTLPTNPSQYIKHSILFSSKNSSYPFSLQNTTVTPIQLETVLSPGVLDLTKQVKITKPTNVDIDPNMSFLVYMIPFCTVTKKTKVI